MNIKILVATHKPYWMPEDNVYLPIHVGKNGKTDIGFVGDDTGDNISNKNINYCELTGLYWAWKNLHADYIGLCHYRRYFAHKYHGNSLESKQKAILSKTDYEVLLQDCDCILPEKRNYYIETVRSQYEHAHSKRDLDEIERIIRELYPKYIPAFHTVMDSKKLHIFNMFVMSREYFNAYCQWLFDILFGLEKRIDISTYNKTEARVFGYLSERLFDVWLEQNRLKYKELNVVFMEKQNWIIKVMKFLQRKFIRKNTGFAKR
jgi:hypothetical protein